jgi:hypothetical protein
MGEPEWNSKCARKIHLFGECLAAHHYLDVEMRKRSRLTANNPSSVDFSDCDRRIQERKEKLRQTEKDYDAHVEEHGC